MKKSIIFEKLTRKHTMKNSKQQNMDNKDNTWISTFTDTPLPVALDSSTH